MHLILTGIGFYVGYCAHRYEEGSEERTQLLLAKYRHAPREWVEMVKVDSDQGAVNIEFVAHLQNYAEFLLLCLFSTTIGDEK
jgi:hypothetical protein